MAEHLEQRNPMNLPDRLHLICNFHTKVVLDPRFAALMAADPTRLVAPPEAGREILQQIYALLEELGYRIPQTPYLNVIQIGYLFSGLVHGLDPQYGPQPVRQRESLSSKDLLEQIEAMWGQGRLLSGYHVGEGEITTFPLTDEAKPLVRQAVQLCLDHDIAPLCSVSGEDGSCDANIIKLSAAAYADLIEKMKRAIKKAG